MFFQCSYWLELGVCYFLTIKLTCYIRDAQINVLDSHGLCTSLETQLVLLTLLSFCSSKFIELNCPPQRPGGRDILSVTVRAGGGRLRRRVLPACHRPPTLRRSDAPPAAEYGAAIQSRRCNCTGDKGDLLSSF